MGEVRENIGLKMEGCPNSRGEASSCTNNCRRNGVNSANSMTGQKQIKTELILLLPGEAKNLLISEYIEIFTRYLTIVETKRQLLKALFMTSFFSVFRLSQANR